MQPNVQTTAYDLADTARNSNYKKTLEVTVRSLSEEECGLVLDALEQLRRKG